MNISEGRDFEKLQSVARAIESVPGSYLLNCAEDPDHHRAVFTFVGRPSSIGQGALAAIRKAAALIDLTQHRGVHPRIGAVDVVPFVPLEGVTMEQCVGIAHALGQRVALELSIPVYFYGEAAQSPERRDLAYIRRGEFEQLLHEIRRDPSRSPDVGPARLHPQAGAVAIGARPLLIAFNVFLDTSDVKVARQIARRIREKNRGLPGVRALGFYLPTRKQVQVSTNVTDYRRAALVDVYDRVCEEASRLGAQAVSSEIVGLVPRGALPESSEQRLRLEKFHAGLLLENRLEEVLADR